MSCLTKHAVNFLKSCSPESVLLGCVSLATEHQYLRCLLLGVQVHQPLPITSKLLMVCHASHTSVRAEVLKASFAPFIDLFICLFIYQNIPGLPVTLRLHRLGSI